MDKRDIGRLNKVLNNINFVIIAYYENKCI